MYSGDFCISYVVCSILLCKWPGKLYSCAVTWLGAVISPFKPLGDKVLNFEVSCFQ